MGQAGWRRRGAELGICSVSSFCGRSGPQIHASLPRGGGGKSPNPSLSHMGCWGSCPTVHSVGCADRVLLVTASALSWCLLAPVGGMENRGWPGTPFCHTVGGWGMGSDSLAALSFSVLPNDLTPCPPRSLHLTLAGGPQPPVLPCCVCVCGGSWCLGTPSVWPQELNWIEGAFRHLPVCRTPLPGQGDSPGLCRQRPCLLGSGAPAPVAATLGYPTESVGSTLCRHLPVALAGLRGAVGGMGRVLGWVHAGCSEMKPTPSLLAPAACTRSDPCTCLGQGGAPPRGSVCWRWWPQHSGLQAAWVSSLKPGPSSCWPRDSLLLDSKALWSGGQGCGPGAAAHKHSAREGSRGTGSLGAPGTGLLLPHPRLALWGAPWAPRPDRGTRPRWPPRPSVSLMVWAAVV